MLQPRKTAAILAYIARRDMVWFEGRCGGGGGGGGSNEARWAAMRFGGSLGSSVTKMPRANLGESCRCRQSRWSWTLLTGISNRLGRWRRLLSVTSQVRLSMIRPLASLTWRSLRLNFLRTFHLTRLDLPSRVDYWYGATSLTKVSGPFCRLFGYRTPEPLIC